MPKKTFQAVTMSCWPSEYAVAFSVVVTLESETLFTAWVMPTPPGRERHGVREGVATDDRHDRVERHRDPVCREEDRDYDELCNPRAERRQQDLDEVVPGAGEDRSALLRLLPEALDPVPEWRMRR